jgi:hypothetical protein
VLGFLPQELLGTSMYEYYHQDDILHLAESHKAALQASDRVSTQVSLSTVITPRYLCLHIARCNFSIKHYTRPLDLLEKKGL